MEFLSIRCDRCRSPVPKCERTQVRFGRDPVRRDPYDLCRDCREWLEVELRLAPAPDLVPFPGPDRAA